MASINGLKQISATSIQNSGQFYLDNDLDAGTAGEVIVSGGSNAAASWGPNGVAVPNALTMGTNINLTSGNPTWDGTLAETINSTFTDTTYTAGSGIDLTGTTFSTDNDGTTINNSGGSGAQNQVLKVPQSITINATPFDGSVARNFSLATSDTTYQGGDNISIDTTTTPDSIDLDQVITGISTITYDGAPSTALTGSNYPGGQTICNYLDLTATTNIIPGTTLGIRANTSTVIAASQSTTPTELNTGFRMSFVAISSTATASFNFVFEQSKKNAIVRTWLYDYNTAAVIVGGRLDAFTTAGVGQISTSANWILTGLTPGTTYYVTPYFSSDVAFGWLLRSGQSATIGYLPGIFKVVDGGSNVSTF
jgi:hypothetical protein|tara:strand:- start:186 stop:1283 length:1098 start_codon:yes stop_codon:yes gene_type:complete